MVEVFKTNLTSSEQAYRLAKKIREQFPGYSINFDLEDCDNILRVEYTQSISVEKLVKQIHKQGFKAELLVGDSTKETD